MQKEFHSFCNHLNYHIFCKTFQRSATVKCIHCMVDTAKPFQIPWNHYAPKEFHKSFLYFDGEWAKRLSNVLWMHTMAFRSFISQITNNCLGRHSKLFMNCVSVSQSLAMEKTVQKMMTLKDDNLFYHEIYNVIGRRLHANSTIAGIDYNILTVALVDHCVTQPPQHNANFVYEWQKKEHNLWSSYVHLSQTFLFSGS